jgi:PAS domain S-box-containing protein
MDDQRLHIAKCRERQRPRSQASDERKILSDSRSMRASTPAVTAASRLMLFAVIVAAIVSGSPGGRAQETNGLKRVVVVYWYDKDYPWNVMFDQSFQAALRSGTSAQVEYHAEYLETNRFPPEQASLLLHDYLQKKYSGMKIDAVVATSDVSLDFLIKNRGDLFTSVPLVFVATKQPPAEVLTKDAEMTGIISINAYRKTLDLALRLHPNTQQVYIISGTLEQDKRIENLARAELQNYEGQVKITYLTDVPSDDLVKQTRALPANCLIIYVWQQSLSSEGAVTESMDILGDIAKSAQAPIYKLSTSSYVGGGVVGGYINTAEANGTRLAQIVQQISRGTPARNIAIESAPTVPEFDWRELQRFGISESQLPPGSTVRFRKVTFWSQYEGRIIIVLLIIFLEGLLIAALLFERRRKQRATKRLSESEQRFAKAFEANPQPMSITTLSEGRYLDVNPSFLAMSGYRRNEVIGHTSEELNNYEKSGERNRLLVDPLLHSHVARNFELKFRTRSGEFRTLLCSAELIELVGEKCILVASSDITDRKALEQELTRLTAQLFRFQDEERRRIARDLHDGTAQNLFAISINLAKLGKLAATERQEMQRLISECTSLGNQSLQEIRTLSYLLHPPLLDEVGLVGALKWYAEGFSKRCGIFVDVIAHPIDRLPADVEMALFRVVQESLTNVHKHSGSGTARIRLENGSSEIVLEVQDHGRGLPERANAGESNDVVEFGVGIPGMRQRLRQLGGRLEINSNGHGTVIRAVLPISNGAHNVTNTSG